MLSSLPSSVSACLCSFFFNDPATTEIYTLSLHDALPISHLSMLHELHLRRHEFDLLHFHVDLIHFPFFEDLAARTVTTLHGRLDLKDLPEVYSRWHDYPLVSISDDQRKPLASANWLATIHHGLAEGVYSFNKMHSDPYLALLGL